jgi:hypothetical protein
VDFVVLVDQVLALLRQRGRVTYRTQQRQFQLDADALTDLLGELRYTHRDAIREDEQGIVWTEDARLMPPATASGDSMARSSQSTKVWSLGGISLPCVHPSTRISGFAIPPKVPRYPCLRVCQPSGESQSQARWPWPRSSACTRSRQEGETAGLRLCERMCWNTTHNYETMARLGILPEHFSLTVL